MSGEPWLIQGGSDGPTKDTYIYSLYTQRCFCGGADTKCVLRNDARSPGKKGNRKKIVKNVFFRDFGFDTI